MSVKTHDDCSTRSSLLLAEFAVLLFKERIMSFRNFTWAVGLALAMPAVGVFAATDAQHESSKTKKDIVDTAVGAKDFTTLVAAVKAAELVDVLKGKGPFTVFAPTDKAFSKIQKEKLESLLKDKKALTAILTYHVVPGKVMAADVVKVDSAKTVLGKPLKIVVKAKKVMINDSQVIKTDIECSNGVIHVVDTVLLPTAE
jgi:uncharacterized surface protein with fasciclin (FAS1) repeats